MAETYSAVVTNLGTSLIEDAYNNSSIVNITQMAIGDSNGAYVEPNPAFTSLVNELGREDIHESSTVGHLIHVYVYVTSKFAGETIREFGLYDDANNLVVYAAYPESLVPDAASGEYIQLEIECIVDLENAEVVNIVVNPIYPHATELEAGIAKIVSEADVDNDEEDSKFLTIKKLLKRAATTLKAGVARFSTSAEAINGTDVTTMLNPSAGLALLKSRISSALDGTRTDYSASESALGQVNTKAVNAQSTANSAVKKSGDTMTGVLGIKAPTPTPLRVWRTTGGTNCNIEYASSLTADEVYPSLFTGVHSNGTAWAVGPAANLSSEQYRWLDVTADGITLKGGVQLGTANDENKNLKVTTKYGYVHIGSTNASYCHFSTDLPEYYFNVGFRVNGEIYCGAGYDQRVFHEGYIPWQLQSRSKSAPDFKEPRFECFQNGVSNPGFPGTYGAGIFIPRISGSYYGFGFWCESGSSDPYIMKQKTDGSGFIFHKLYTENFPPPNTSPVRVIILSPEVITSMGSYTFPDGITWYDIVELGVTWTGTTGTTIQTNVYDTHVWNGVSLNSSTTDFAGYLPVASTGLNFGTVAKASGNGFTLSTTSASGKVQGMYAYITAEAAARLATRNMHIDKAGNIFDAKKIVQLAKNITTAKEHAELEAKEIRDWNDSIFMEIVHQRSLLDAIQEEPESASKSRMIIKHEEEISLLESKYKAEPESNSLTK